MGENKRAILVTGATGFPGYRLCERLKREGEAVIALGREPAEGPWDTFLAVDLSREGPPPEPLKQVKVIHHIPGGEHGDGGRPADTDAFLKGIVTGTERMLEAATEVGIGRFIHLGSVKAMGEGNPPELPLHPIDESWPHTPQSPYGLAHAEAEERVLKAGLEHAVILRPVTVFGPGGCGSLYRMVEAVRRGRFPPVPETGNRRSMIHVDDVVEFVIRATQRPVSSGRTYILAAPEPVSARQLDQAIRESQGMPRRNGSCPLWLLRVAAATGTVAGAIRGRRPLFDGAMLESLTRSEWYSPERAQADLGYVAERTVHDWLTVGD